MGKSILYLVLLIAMILTAIDIWYVTNVFEIRQIGYLFWEGGLTILLLLISAILSYNFLTDKNARYGFITIIGLLIFDTLLMLNYAPLVEFVERLSYYFHLALTASIIILIGMIGNIARIEKKHEEGFAVNLYSKDSPIPPKMIIPVWLLVFFGMGGLVLVSGTVLVQYPSFGAIMPFLGGPATSGFGVGDWENVVFLIFPFALAFGLAKYYRGMPNDAAFLIGLIVGFIAFTEYHFLVYQTNMIANIIVAAFGLMSLASYYYTKSIAIMSAMHIGNNFWGALFAVNVIGLSVFGIMAPLSTVLFSIFMMALMAGLIIIIIKKYGKKRRKK